MFQLMQHSAISEHKLQLRLPSTSTRYNKIINTDERYNHNSNDSRKCKNYYTNTLIRQLIFFITVFLLSIISAVSTVGASPIDQYSVNNINKRMVSYAMIDSFSPLDSYLYSFYPPSTAVSSTTDAKELITPVEIPEMFRPGKREGKRSDDIPGVLRFGKRESDIPGVLRFGKRDNDMPGVLRFGKREVPGVLRFGKKRSDSDIPGVLRFGKRSDNLMPGVLRFGKRYDLHANEIPAGVLRFGKKSDDMPGVLRFGRK